MAEINRELTVRWAQAAASAPFGMVTGWPPARPPADANV